MNTPSDNRFRINIKDFLWSVKLFAISGIVAFIFSIAVYAVMTIFSEPQPVDDAIVATASTAMSKVEIGTRYVSPMWSIFVFNTIAIFTASFGTGLFPYIHNLLIGEFSFRSKHRVYTAISIKIDKLFTFIYRQLQRIASIFDPGFPKIKINMKNKIETQTGIKTEIRTEVEEQTHQGDGTSSVWDLCVYTRDDYRMFAYTLPYTIPVLILLVNGFLFGILLAFFVFNGAMSGYEIMGLEGIVIGGFYTFSYFGFSILPHGIIELPVLFLAASVGYKFAYVQSNAVADDGFFLGDDIESVKEDVLRINSITAMYLRSGYLWNVFGVAVGLLLVAAYIEIYVTPEIVEYVMGVVETVLNGGFV